MRNSSLFVVMFGSACATAQQTEVTRYDVDQGLPQSMVNHVLQDADGFIWLGTGDGLARFDGHRFISYKHDPRAAESLSHNSIWGIMEQDERHLLIGTRTGLDLLDRRTGRFAHAATSLPEKQDGCWQPVWRRADGALLYSPLTRTLLRVQEGSSSLQQLRHTASYAMHADPGSGTITQVLWPDTLLTLLPDGQERIDRLPNPRQERITGLLPLGSRWLMLTDLSAWTWSAEEGRRPLPPETQAWMDRASKGKRGAIGPDGGIWVSQSGAGVAVLDRDLRIVQRYPLLPEHERPLDITVIAFDRQGNAWVGTDGKGVFRIAPQRIRFGRCMPGQGMGWEPPSWFVRGFAQWDAHQVLVHLYQGGFALFDERTDALQPLELPYSTRTALADPEHSGPWTDAQGALWLRDIYSVTALEPGTGRLLLPHRTTHGNALAIGPDGDAVVISREGLHAMRHGPDGIRALPLPSDSLRRWMSAVKTVPSRLAFDHRGRLLACQSTMPIAVWQNDRPIPAGPFPSSTRFTAVAQGAEGDLWMTTNEGLYLLSGTDLSVKRHWTVHDGLPDQFLYGMLQGDDGAWWISSNKGLCRFDPARDAFTAFGPMDGLQSTEFNSGAFLRSASGRLYFGGINGFNHFRPASLRIDPDTPLVALIGLVAQDSVVDAAALGDAPAIVLPFGRNQLLIDLAVLEMTAPERNHYRWRITGYSDWAEQPADRPITLTNMPAGRFTLEVIGVNGDGIASAPRTVLAIAVPLPFTASPGFFVLLGGLLIGGLGAAGFLLYRQHVRRRQQRAEQELKEMRIRARIAHDLHDDVGSGLARITALARTAERKGAKGEDAAGDVQRVRALSQELMQDLRDVVWVNDPRDGDLAALLLRLRAYVQDLFEPTGADCVFDFPDPLPERRIGSQARRNLFLIAKEAAHNAFKYSGARRVTVRFELDATGFALELADNGKGLDAGVAPQGGHGLANMRQRAAELGADCAIAAAVDGGTSVRVAGPLPALDL